MNRALRASSLLCPQTTTSLHPTAPFHSSTVLSRKRNSRYTFTNYTSDFRRKEAKRTLLRDASLHLEHFLNGFKNSRYNDFKNLSSGYTSWFEKQYFTKGRKKRGFCNLESQWNSKLKAQFRNGPGQVFWCDNGTEDFETIFGRSSEEKQGFYQSFHSSGFHNHYTRCEQKRSSRDWKHESDDEGSNLTMSDLVSEKQTLGLAISGPLNLKDIKNAYHACALRWHPDRHQGSSKVEAEEKFKHCTAAYKALCDRLTET